MKIEGMCTHSIVTADRSRTLQECAALMGENHVGSVLVTEETPGGPQAVGIVSPFFGTKNSKPCVAWRLRRAFPRSAFGRSFSCTAARCTFLPSAA